MIFKLGLPYWGSPPPETPFIRIVIIEIVLNAIWGIFIGIIFSKIHDLIPGKGVLKGLIFGLAYYLVTSVRIAFSAATYGLIPFVFTGLLRFSPILYGLILGILFKAPKEKMKITKYDIKSGIIPGLITGLIFGIAVEIMWVLSAYFGTTFGFMEIYPDYLTDIGFIISQWGSHMFFNMVMWGIFGAFYAMFYDRMPGKALVKGAVFGLIHWLITSFQMGVYCLAYGQLSTALWVGLIYADLYIFGGLLLEGFYKRRSRAFLIAGIVFVIGIIRNMIPLG